MVLYVICSIVALFCIIALGWGPVFFAAVGAVVFFVGFRARRQRWWGLGLAAGGLALALGSLAGWRWKTIVAVVLAMFVAAVSARFVGRSMNSASDTR